MNEYDSQAKLLLGHDYVTVTLIKDHKFINSIWSYLHAVNRVHHTVLHYACQRSRSKMNGHFFCWKAFIFRFIHSSKRESYRLQLWNNCDTLKLDQNVRVSWSCVFTEHPPYWIHNSAYSEAMWLASWPIKRQKAQGEPIRF